MSIEIAEFLHACGEPEMAEAVENMHSRLEAFADGMDRDAIDAAGTAVETLTKQRDELLAALEDLLNFTPDPPDPNCSCHISPPCADCIDNGGTREAIETAKEVVASVKGGA